MFGSCVSITLTFSISPSSIADFNSEHSVTAASVTRLQFQWAVFHATDPDANYSVRCSISQIETGLALVTGCVPDLFPMLRRCCPNFLRDDTDILEPNPYPVGSGSGSSYSHRMKVL